MNKRKTAQLNMISTTISFCEKNTIATAGIPAFASALSLARSKYNTINQLNQRVIPGTTGVTTNTANMRLSVADLALVIANALVAYAASISNHDLLQKVNYTHNKLRKLTKTDFEDTIKNILAEAISNVVAASPFGYNNTDITALQAALNVYAPAKQNPRQARISIKSANQQIAQLIKDIIQNIFKHQMDHMVATLATTNQTFYSSYNHARMIVDLPSIPKQEQSTH